MIILNDENSNDLIDYSNYNLIRDIGRLLHPYRWRFIAASFLRFSGDVANLYPFYALASITTFFSKYTPGTSLRYFWIIMSLWILATFGRNLTNHLSKYLGFQVSEKVALDAQVQTIKHLYLLDIAWHEKENAGNKLKRIQKGGAGLDRILRMWINNFIEIGVNFTAIIIIIGMTDKLISLIIFIFLITYFSFSFLLLKKASDVSQEVDIKEEEILGLVFQTLNNIRSVKVMAMGKRMLEMIEVQVLELIKKIRTRIFRFQTRGTLLDSWAIIFRMSIIIIISLGIAQGRLELGFLILFYGYFNRILESVSELAEASQDLIIAKYGIARMQKTLEAPILIESEKNKVSFPKNWQKIEIKGLTFSYGKHKVLENVSFEIKRGERIGIVGLSGAGKSTLMKLLLKENESFQGDILFDGLSLKKIKKNSYFNHVGVVLQDTEVFNFTLRDNITIASAKEGTKKDLENALHIAHIHDFIHKLPAGVDTFIGEKGVKLSGGERQRLGLARAIYKQPQILFLDEATSHLDLESEEKIRESLHEFFQKVTAVVIAHRLTTIREMDKILVIEKGRILESGSFDELFALKGRFFDLWEKQKL